MLRPLLCCLALGGAAIPLFAGPQEAAIVAAMRLSEAANYSWVATVADDARTYDIRGQTAKDGFTRVTMPVINSVRRRLGRSVTDTQIELIFRGNVHCVVEFEGTWMTPDELPPPSEPISAASQVPYPSGALDPRGLGLPGGGIVGAGGLPLPGPPPEELEDRKRGYSNLQLAISLPHEELGIIVGSQTALTIEGNAVSGTLPDASAQLLLVRDGQKEITPLRAAGTFKLWLQAGIVSRYQVRLEGVLQIDTATGRRKVVVNQTTETTIREVGTTKVAVPDQARIKLLR